MICGIAFATETKIMVLISMGMSELIKCSACCNALYKAVPLFSLSFFSFKIYAFGNLSDLQYVETIL